MSQITLSKAANPDLAQGQGLMPSPGRSTSQTTAWRAKRGPLLPSLTTGDPALARCMPRWDNSAFTDQSPAANAPVGNQQAVLQSVKPNPKTGVSLAPALAPSRSDADMVLTMLAMAGRTH